MSWRGRGFWAVGKPPQQAEDAFAGLGPTAQDGDEQDKRDD